MSGLRIGHLSDFHCDSDTAIERTSQAVRMLMAKSPDAVMLTGDYISGKRSARYLPAVAHALEPVTRAPMGAFAVLGNHDWWSGLQDEIAGVLADVGIVVLRNVSTRLGETGVHIVGLDDAYVRRMDVGQARRAVPVDEPAIVLVHEPDVADRIGDGFDLQLSGHSHGGQVRCPGLPVLHCPPLGRRYIEGLNRGRRHWVYTTRGVGAAGIPIRLFCPPEVTLLTLHSSN